MYDAFPTLHKFKGMTKLQVQVTSSDGWDFLDQASALLEETAERLAQMAAEARVTGLVIYTDDGDDVNIHYAERDSLYAIVNGEGG